MTISVSRSILKASLLGAVCAAALFAAPTDVQAQDAGIYELAVQRPWRRVADKKSACRFNGYLNQGNGFQIVYDKDSERTSIRYIAPVETFVENRVYQADVYIDFETHFGATSTPLSAKTIEVTAMDTRRFNKVFDGAEEFSFGIDETLYVLNLARIPFPLDEYKDCVRNQQPKDIGIVDAISKMNPFSIPEDLKEEDISAQQDAEKAEKDLLEAAGEEVTMEVEPPKWRPFLTSAGGPFALKPKGVGELKDAVKEMDKAAENDLEDENAEDYSKSYKELEMQSAPVACGPSGGMYEFSQIPEAEMPPEMRGLRGFMAGNDNSDADKELIHSLLVQLDLLEKEKEALRRKAPESYSPVSVIRSCQREDEKIEDLNMQLIQAEEEQFELLKRQEIQNGLIGAYEGLDEQAAAAAESIVAVESSSDDEVSEGDIIEAPQKIDNPLLDAELFEAQIEENSQ